MGWSASNSTTIWFTFLKVNNDGQQWEWRAEGDKKGKRIASQSIFNGLSSGSKFRIWNLFLLRNFSCLLSLLHSRTLSPPFTQRTHHSIELNSMHSALWSDEWMESINDHHECQLRANNRHFRNWFIAKLITFSQPGSGQCPTQYENETKLGNIKIHLCKSHVIPCSHVEMMILQRKLQISCGYAEKCSAGNNWNNLKMLYTSDEC